MTNRQLRKLLRRFNRNAIVYDENGNELISFKATLNEQGQWKIFFTTKKPTENNEKHLDKVEKS